MAEQHGNKLGPAGEAFRTSFRLMFCNQVSKLGSREMTEKLTKQAGTLYHGCTLPWLVCYGFYWRENLVAHSTRRGFRLKSYFGQE